MRTYVSSLQSAEVPKDVNKAMARFGQMLGMTSVHDDHESVVKEGEAYGKFQ
jgi:hypothetical protein